MITIDYYPKRSRLDFTDSNGVPVCGIIGNLAHLRAAAIMTSGSAIVRLCLDRAISKKHKTLNINFLNL